MNTTQRFSSAPWFEGINDFKYFVVGVGTIGSWASLLLSRLGTKRLVLYDADTVEINNLAGQFFGLHNIGHQKTYSMQNNIQAFSNVRAYIYNGMVDGNTEMKPHDDNIIVTGLDSMRARKDVWESIKKNFNRSNAWVIDGRMSAEGLQIITFNTKDTHYVEKYEKEWLFSDEESTGGEVCSYKQTSHIGAMIGSLITNIVTNIITNKKTPDMRDIPFLIQYTADQIDFKTSI